MRRICKLMFTALCVAMAVVACNRRSSYEDCPEDVMIPVQIDWSISGITPTVSVMTIENSSDFVHRVSIRFFPKDGSPAFDRYLEGNVLKGKISVPVGRYSVIVYNEAVDDIYWSDAIRFMDVDNYNLFSANIVDFSPLPYDFYTPQPNEKFASGVFKLASWSLDDFEVTPDMRNCKPCLSSPDNMINALTKVVLRRLTIPIHVVVEVTNLKSANRMEGALTGIAGKVNMASGQTEIVPVTHLFTFSSPIWSDPSKTHGRVERRFLTFGHMMSQTSSYFLHLGVLFVTGERYEPLQPLQYDVTSQIMAVSVSGDIDISVILPLPVVNEGIDVGGWDDEEHTIH